ncbi:hypothetical protein D3C73_1435050 [compost metagenome]
MLGNPFIFAVFDQLADEFIPGILFVLHQIIEIIVKFDHWRLGQQLLALDRQQRRRHDKKFTGHFQFQLLHIV